MTFSVVAARRPASLFALLALIAPTAACQRHAAPPVAVQVVERGPQRPADGTPGFVGRWAATPAACASRAWVLTSDALRSPSVLACSFDRVSPTDAGYAVDSVCTVGKARAPGRLTFTLTGRGEARSLTVDGGPFTEPVALAHCPGPATLQSASAGTGQGG
jgi:hypothetical protein